MLSTEIHHFVPQNHTQIHYTTSVEIIRLPQRIAYSNRSPTCSVLPRFRSALVFNLYWSFAVFSVQNALWPEEVKGRKRKPPANRYSKESSEAKKMRLNDPKGCAKQLSSNWPFDRLACVCVDSQVSDNPVTFSKCHAHYFKEEAPGLEQSCSWRCGNWQWNRSVYFWQWRSWGWHGIWGI